jgi:dolichol kinase
VGRKIKSAQFFEKSVAGSLAFGISALLILVVCGLFFKQEFVFYSFGILAIFVTTIIEARPSLFGKLDDNFTIPLSFSLVVYLLGIIWDVNYYPSF